ncbi:hypothetical protein CD944_06860 [Brevundimonas diminuta]|nr:hypothetical protein CD944_06860 [Brevundimonas diminuta]
MAAIRSMLARMAKLEVEQVPPVLAKFGGEEGWAAFEAETETGIAEGRYDSRDMPAVLKALQAWLHLGKLS